MDKGRPGQNLHDLDTISKVVINSFLRHLGHKISQIIFLLLSFSQAGITYQIVN